ncbi:MAG: flagellar hook-basal body complex protein FliE [Clostridia bacterium]|jgi:flagellar hook-basal body complex protein FliE|nr:flagellar hook-basal body complex protein FliE [Clostridiaceae bacterium]
MDKVNSILSAWELQRANRLDEYLSLQVRNGSSGEFKSFLDQALEEVNRTEKAEQEMGLSLTTGEINNLHSIMISAEKADITLSLALQIRNKVIEAYENIMRMQI